MTISANVLSLGVYAYRTALLFGRPTHVSTARTDAAKGANEAVRESRSRARRASCTSPHTNRIWLLPILSPITHCAGDDVQCDEEIREVLLTGHDVHERHW